MSNNRKRQRLPDSEEDERFGSVNNGLVAVVNNSSSLSSVEDRQVRPRNDGNEIASNLLGLLLNSQNSRYLPPARLAGFTDDELLQLASSSLQRTTTTNQGRTSIGNPQNGILTNLVGQGLSRNTNTPHLPNVAAAALTSRNLSTNMSGLPRTVADSGSSNNANAAATSALLSQLLNPQSGSRTLPPTYPLNPLASLTGSASLLGINQDLALAQHRESLIQQQREALVLQQQQRRLFDGEGRAGMLPTPWVPSAASLPVPQQQREERIDIQPPFADSKGLPVDDLPVILCLSDDNLKLSDHQVLLRQQIEVFRASEDDITTHTRGRNKPITLGQVGIRCRHCVHLTVSKRQRGSAYFPASTIGLYQAAQNMSTTHIQCGLCSEMPDSLKSRFATLLGRKNICSGAGRKHWAKRAEILGLCDTADGIRFHKDVSPREATGGRGEGKEGNDN